MVSNSTDIHPILEGTIAKMADYQVSCSFLFFLEDLVLLLPFFIHIKLSVSEMASCTFYYYHAIRSYSRVLHQQKLFCLWRLSAETAQSMITRTSRAKET